LKKYDVTLTAHYRKTVSVCAESPEQAKEKTKIILFDTDLINFTDADFVCGEADITEQSEDGLDGANYAQTECQFRYCGTAIPFLTVRSTAR